MLRQDSGTRDITEKSSVREVDLAERKGSIDTEKVAALARSPAIFRYFAESSVVVGNTGEDLRSGEVYDEKISSDDKSARMELFHRHSDEPPEDLNCSKCVFLDPSIDVKFVDKENICNLNKSLFRTMHSDDLKGKHGEDENAEECRSLIDEESDQDSSSTLSWSLKRRVEVFGTNHLILEGGGLEFVADIAVAENALGEYPDLQAQSVSAGHLKDCVSFLYERIEGVSQSGDRATLHHEGDLNGNKLRRRVFDPGGLGLRIDHCQGCRSDVSFTV